MEHYRTTHEQVVEVAQSLRTSRDLAHALLERGHTEAEIREMTPARRFDEFCQWHGLIGWGPTLRAVMRDAIRIRARDSDRYGEADETRSGSVPEGDRARAEGIARKDLQP